MTTYEYLCPRCGIVRIACAMGSAPQATECAGCGAPARRTYSMPHVHRTATPLAEALARAEKSREEPEVCYRTT